MIIAIWHDRCAIACVVPGSPGGVPRWNNPMKAKRHYQCAKETLMNWNVIEGNWKQVKGTVKQQWGRLTDDQLEMVSGKRDQLVGKIQECYGIARDEAERQVTNWEEQYGDILDKSIRRTRKNADTAQH